MEKVIKEININRRIQISEPKCMPNTDVILPHVFVGNEAFKLMETMIRPYPRNQMKKKPFLTTV